jgi:hypothetical protein
MSSVEPSALGLLRRCWRRLFGDRGRGDARLLEELRGEGRYREKPKEEVEALGLRLNDILN